MEYKIFRSIRTNIQLPYILRLFFALFLITISTIPIILPIFPGSLFLGVVMLIVGILLFVKARKIRHVIKLRKGIIYMFKNLHNKHILRHKMRDIKKHVLHILDEKRKK